MSEESAVQGEKDWHSSKQIRKRARYLLEHPDDEIPSDVTFLVGDGQNEPQKTFKCHKFILAMVSAMFQAMFYGSLPQTDDIVKIPDVTPAAFQYMLRYAYGDIDDFTDVCLDEVLDTLYCAKRYLIPKLARACRDHIQFEITVSIHYELGVSDLDPCVIFQRAPQMDEENLASLALSTIARLCCSVMEGYAFPRLSFDCVQRILDYPHLRTQEIDIYRGVRRWVEHNVGVVTGSALREAMGALLYSIRFPALTPGQLFTGPIQDGLLTEDEAEQLLLLRNSGSVDPALPFLTTPRTSLHDDSGYTVYLVPHSLLIQGHLIDHLVLHFVSDLAPECCAFLRHLADNHLHIRIATYDNLHVGRTAPLPAAVQSERNVLSHSVPGACWFEWDMEGDVARNVRIGVAGRPHRYHSAVFGFILYCDAGDDFVAFTAWQDPRIRGLDNFISMDIISAVVDN